MKKFEICAANSQVTNTPRITPNLFVQHLVDNVDHNIRTLDGFNTFHRMGIIATVTPGIKHQTPIQRESATAHDIALKAKIDIHFFRPTQEVTSLFYDTQILVKGQGSN